MGFTRMEPKLGLGKAHGLWLYPTLICLGEEQTREHYCNPTRFPRSPVGPTREGPTMVGLDSRVGFRWNAVGGGCGGRGVSTNTGGRCNALEPTADYGTRECVCLRDPTKR